MIGADGFVNRIKKKGESLVTMICQKEDSYFCRREGSAYLSTLIEGNMSVEGNFHYIRLFGLLDCVVPTTICIPTFIFIFLVINASPITGTKAGLVHTLRLNRHNMLPQRATRHS